MAVERETKTLKMDGMFTVDDKRRLQDWIKVKKEKKEIKKECNRKSL